MPLEYCEERKSFSEDLVNAIQRIDGSVNRKQFESDREFFNEVIDQIAYEFQKRDVDFQNEVNRFLGK